MRPFGKHAHPFLPPLPILFPYSPPRTQTSGGGGRGRGKKARQDSDEDYEDGTEDKSADPDSFAPAKGPGSRAGGSGWLGLSSDAFNKQITLLALILTLLVYLSAVPASEPVELHCLNWWRL